MNILYADDDQLSLEIVLRALEVRGHRVTIVNSSRVAEMWSQFQQLLSSGPTPHLVILDGHNINRDAEGQSIIDVEPALLMGWLRKNGLPENIPFVLYSSDEYLVAQAQADRQTGFWAAVPKVGQTGGLKALLQVVEAKDGFPLN